jgi:hypothetical protein
MPFFSLRIYLTPHIDRRHHHRRQKNDSGEILSLDAKDRQPFELIWKTNDYIRAELSSVALTPFFPVVNLFYRTWTFADTCFLLVCFSFSQSGEARRTAHHFQVGMPYQVIACHFELFPVSVIKLEVGI